jgi:hypothetical protein
MLASVQINPNLPRCKPQTPNILITPEGNVKLVDFGLGNRFGLQRLKTICGWFTMHVLLMIATFKNHANIHQRFYALLFSRDNKRSEILWARD